MHCVVHARESNDVCLLSPPLEDAEERQKRIKKLSSIVTDSKN